MKHSNLGMSLVELMIALLVGLILMGGVITLFIETSANIKKTEQISALSSEGQFALSVMAHDLAMAGFWGQAFDPQDISYDATVFDNSNPGSTIDSDCGPVVTRAVNGTPNQLLAWAYNALVPVEEYDDADGGLSAEFPCLSDVVPGTDVLAIRRVAGFTSATLEADRVYMRANQQQGVLYRNTAGAPSSPPAGTVEDWEYRPMVYYIRDHTRNSGDGIPSLCQKLLRATNPPRFETECLAAGIEDMQLEFGIDTDSDQAPNYFEGDPSDAELALLSAVRIHLLARAPRLHTRFEDKNTYVLGDKTFTPTPDDFHNEDHYFRKVFTQTVPVRNPARVNTIYR